MVAWETLTWLMVHLVFGPNFAGDISVVCLLTGDFDLESKSNLVLCFSD